MHQQLNQCLERIYRCDVKQIDPVYKKFKSKKKKKINGSCKIEYLKKLMHEFIIHLPFRRYISVGHPM